MTQNACMKKNDKYQVCKYKQQNLDSSIQFKVIKVEKCTKKLRLKRETLNLLKRTLLWWVELVTRLSKIKIWFLVGLEESQSAN